MRGVLTEDGLEVWYQKTTLYRTGQGIPLFCIRYCLLSQNQLGLLLQVLSGLSAVSLSGWQQWLIQVLSAQKVYSETGRLLDDLFADLIGLGFWLVCLSRSEVRDGVCFLSLPISL
ncbi:hypothetical protein ILYODFUR_030035 [Ilyodon furcidens]|uniref:Uncharacterized protein n=1 Tax=Ilyodon furcidens TaxID=33524 RepID=A0ABV0V873_9TELE